MPKLLPFFGQGRRLDRVYLTGNPDWTVTAFDALLVAMFLLQLFECGVLLYICSLLRGAQRYANEAIDATVIGVEQLHPEKKWGIPMDGR